MSRATAPGSSCAFVVTCSRHRRRRLTGEPCEPVCRERASAQSYPDGSAKGCGDGRVYRHRFRTGRMQGAALVDGCEEPAPPGRGEARGSRARGRLPRARRPSCRRGPAAREPSCAALTLRRRRGAGGRRRGAPRPAPGGAQMRPRAARYVYYVYVLLRLAISRGRTLSWRSIDLCPCPPTAAHAEVRQPQAEAATTLCPPRRGGRSTVHAPHRLSRRRRRRPTCARVLCFVSRSRDGMRTSDPGSSTH